MVLSGGESRRMGQDKGLIRTDSATWVNKAGALLKRVGVPVSIMIREEQLPAYQAAVQEDFELLLDQNVKVGGPLKGLLSFHHRYPEADVVVLPCDMPHVTETVLSELLAYREHHPACDVWVYEVGERIQPFPGIYAASHLAAINQQLQSDTAAKVCLMDVVRQGRTAVLEAEAHAAAAFMNANYPEDIG